MPVSWFWQMGVQIQVLKCMYMHWHLPTSLFQISFYKMELECSATSQELFQSKHNSHYYALIVKISI